MSTLTYIILWPLVSAVLLCFVPREQRVTVRAVALFSTGMTLLLAIRLFLRFDTGVATYQFVQNVPWVPALDIRYHVGVDGINVGLILMAALVAFTAACVSWEIQRREKEFYVLLLTLTGGILGAFASLDLLFFYVFHELALVPTFLMIGVWGRGERKNYAAFQMTLYLSAGALLALAGLIALYLLSGAETFNLVALADHLQRQPLSGRIQSVLFPVLLFGFGVLVSLWPFHTWAPLGYSSAPTATAMLHAGVLKKFGLYALIRIAVPLLPEGAASWMTLLAWLCLGNLAYCGLVAIRQKDLNGLISYSSVAHMGFVFLGIAAYNLTGLTGAVYVMIAHGLLAALAFALSGYVYHQTGTLEFARLGGLLRPMPFVGAAMIMAMLAGCGVPGFANFVGELLVLFGAWKSFTLVTILALWSALIIGAVYMFRAIRSLWHGPLAAGLTGIQDATGAWRRLPFVLLIAALLLFGCFPRLLTEKIQPSIREGLRQNPPTVAPLVMDPPAADDLANLASSLPRAGEIGMMFLHRPLTLGN